MSTASGRPHVSLLFSDIDRTILTTDYRLPSEVSEAFGRLRNQGVRLVLASARSPRGVALVARELDVEFAACFNGGWIGNLRSGHAISATTMDRDVALSVMDTAAQSDLSAMWYTSSGVYVTRDDEFVRREAEITGEELTLVDSLDDLPGRPFKIMNVRSSTDPAAFERISNEYSDACSVVMSNWRLLEVTPSNVSKGAAVSAVASAFGVPREACAAAGDAENDIGMLRWAGTPLTVANAIPFILNIAHFIGPSVDEGGMANVVDWLLSRNKLSGLQSSQM